MTKPVKSWFKLDGQGDGAYERTLQEQMIGLRPLIDEVVQAKKRSRPLTILDVGCGEGLISIELARLGAAHCHGIEITPQRVADARRLRGSLPCTFEHTDASNYSPPKPVDVVMALSILHKLPNPSWTLTHMVNLKCMRMVVIRLPPGRGPVVQDRRSGNVPHNLDAVLRNLGFQLVEETEGPRAEWCGFWRLKE